MGGIVYNCPLAALRAIFLPDRTESAFADKRGDAEKFSGLALTGGLQGRRPLPFFSKHRTALLWHQ